MRQFVRWSQGLAAVLAVLGMMSVVAPASAAGSSCLPASIKAKLAQIKSKFGPVKIVSTFRKGARIAGTGKRSHHASCRAVDFHAPKGKYSQVVSWLKKTHSGGVGTYSCGMHHIHIDNGSRVRFHKCVNSRGARIGKKSKRRYASKKRNKKYSKKKYKAKGSKKRYAGKRGKKSKNKKYASKRKSSKKSYYAKKKKTAKVRVARAPSPGGRITAYSR